MEASAKLTAIDDANADEGVLPPAILTSGATYAAAFLATTVLHELAHFVVALGFGRAPVLFHNAVDSQPAGTLATVATSLAGPIFSAVQGVGLAVLEPRTRMLSPVVRLFITWFAFHGLMNATGYVFTTWFAAGGDLGKAARLLGVPLVGLIALTALGFWLIRLGARSIYPAFVALLPDASRSDVAQRNRGLVRIALLAWPIGVALSLAASFPVPHWISLMYVFTAGFGAVWFTDFSKAQSAAPSVTGARLPNRWHVLPWVAWAALVALCMLVLRHGVSFD